MIHRMSDRCRRICGTEDRNCYINSKEQLKCLTDVVVNKTAGISMVLGLSLAETKKEVIDEGVRESIASSNELSNWVKYLQLIGDLRELSSLVLDADSNDKRKEVRYPMPENLSDKIRARVKHRGSYHETFIMNFSQSGIRLKSAELFEAGALTECILTAESVGGEVPFKVRIKYCAGKDGEYFSGARVEEVSGSSMFNLFNNVFYFITELEIAGGS